jgi:hypothetical protein
VRGRHWVFGTGFISFCYLDFAPQQPTRVGKGGPSFQFSFVSGGMGPSTHPGSPFYRDFGVTPRNKEVRGPCGISCAGTRRRRRVSCKADVRSCGGSTLWVTVLERCTRCHIACASIVYSGTLNIIPALYDRDCRPCVLMMFDHHFHVFFQFLNEFEPYLSILLLPFL